MARSRRNNPRISIAMIAAVALCIGMSAEAKVVERIVAVVNGDVVTLTELDEHIKSERLNKKPDVGPAAETQERKDALNDMIDAILLKQAIETAEIDVTDEDVERALRNIQTQNGMTQAQLRHEIARKGMTFKEYENQLKKEIKKIKFVNQVIGSEVKVTDRDLRDYFEKHKVGFLGGSKVRLAEIVLDISTITSEKEAFALRDRAIAIVKQARENPSSFDRLAKQYSQGPNAASGGDLGVIEIKDLPERVGGTVKHMPAGAISDPIPTDNAVIIVKVVEWPEVNEDDFNDVRDNIYQRLHAERLDDALDSYLQRMKQHAYIEMR